MTSHSQEFVDPLRIQPQEKLLWRGNDSIRLPKMPFEVLCYLVDRREQLVRKEELLEKFWPTGGTKKDVYEEALTQCISEIRSKLGDARKNPRYIETVNRYGYRFIGPIAADSSQPPPIPFRPSISYFVGRERELEKLHKLFGKVSSGERQIVFVTGEPGIGKTTLVREFVRDLAARGIAAVGRGQCIEHYGSGEAYLPVLEAIGRLCRDPRGTFLIEWMKQHTPTWLVQMPTLLNASDLEEVQRRVQGATRDRMLREMSEGLELFSEQMPIVLVLEDLHWSDVSTLDLLSSLARQTEPARLLIIGTYRPEEASPPLRAIIQELQGHQQGQELSLPLFNEGAVREYIQQRFPTATLPIRLPEILHCNTEGNPLFLAVILDDLLERGVISQVDDQWVLQGQVEAIVAEVPVSIRQLLTRQIDRLTSKEQQILQAASIAGQEFLSAVVAAAIEVDTTEVEECCAALVRRQHFLYPLGYSEWPDGVRTARYSFRHALYQYLWNERVPVGQRQRFHIRIGERLEKGYGGRASEIAAELAVHFEEGKDYKRAIGYLQLAARNALQRSAHAEAANLLAKGIELLKTLPETPERIQQELMLHLARGGPLIATKGYGAPEVEAAYARAFELCHQSKEKSYLLQAQQGLAAFYSIRGQFQKARQLGEQCLVSAQQMGDPSRLLQAEWTLGQTLFHLGDFVSARQHVEHALALYDPRQHRSRAVQDLGVTSHSYLAWGFWFLGYPEQALATNHKALTLAQDLSHSFSVAYALIFAAGIYQFCGDGHRAQEIAEKAIILCREQGFPMWLAFGEIFRGWVLIRQGQEEEGIARILQGLKAWKETGAEASRPLVLAMLAEAYGRIGKVEEGLATLRDALVIAHENEEHYYEAELYRLKGELTLKQPRGRSSRSVVHLEAEKCFLQAIEVARHLSMKSLELRAVTSLSLLWQQQGKTTEARKILAEIYHWFTEGFDTADLKTAKSLLAQLSRKSSNRITANSRRE